MTRTEQPSARTDQELVEAVRAERPGAWEALVTRFERLVFAVPRKMGLPAADAEEVFQNTWLCLYRHIQLIENPASVSSWIMTTARREVWRLQRRRARERSAEEVDEIVPDLNPDPSDSLETLELREQVRDGVSELSARCREIIHLLFFAGEEPAYAEVAEQLGMPIGSLGPTRIRCLERLDAVLRKKGMSL